MILKIQSMMTLTDVFIFNIVTTMNLFVELRKKIFRIHNREVIDSYFCSLYDDYDNGVLEVKRLYWEMEILSAYNKYGETDDEDFPFKVNESPFYDNE